MSTLYESIGQTYTSTRKPDPRIAEQIRVALGNARTVLNVGGGAGNYEPSDRTVFALDPSMTMLRQRKADAGPVVCGVARHLLSDVIPSTQSWGPSRCTIGVTSNVAYTKFVGLARSDVGRVGPGDASGWHRTIADVTHFGRLGGPLWLPSVSNVDRPRLPIDRGRKLVSCGKRCS